MKLEIGLGRDDLTSDYVHDLSLLKVATPLHRVWLDCGWCMCDSRPANHHSLGVESTHFTHAHQAFWRGVG